MKRILFAIAIFCAATFTLGAQSYGYVNTQKILEKVPEYVKAQSQLETEASGYSKEIENSMKNVESMFNRYQAEKPRLNEQQRLARENEIIAMEKEVKERQKGYFGEEGTAAETGSAFVIDISSAQGIIYTNPRYDLTAKVLKKLNLQ
ncbi:MAG: Outer Membrane Chaperone Skp [Bacteroidetes bacterium]|nr:Outer Membrane Chaperone Skp [Bacteroidota bacterium]